MKIVIKYIIAILPESKLVDNKEQERLEMHYGFKQENPMKDIESYFTTENESTISTGRQILISGSVIFIKKIDK